MSAEDDRTYATAARMFSEYIEDELMHVPTLGVLLKAALTGKVFVQAGTDSHPFPRVQSLGEIPIYPEIRQYNRVLKYIGDRAWDKLKGRFPEELVPYFERTRTFNEDVRSGGVLVTPYDRHGPVPQRELVPSGR